VEVGFFDKAIVSAKLFEDEPPEPEWTPISVIAYSVILKKFADFHSAERPLKFGEYQRYKNQLPPRLDRVEELLYDPDPYWNWYAALVLEIAQELETIEVQPFKKK
jgi:hypothetical protein